MAPPIDISQKSILIVDDTPANLRLLVEILSKQGYQVRPATNGIRALTAVRAELADLILLDIKMPDITGYEVCQELKADERTRDIPVIFISALDDIDDKIKGFSLGGVDYITKPFQAEEVLARVKTHLTLRTLQRNLEDLVTLRTQELQQRNTQLEEKNIELQQAQNALQKAKEAVEAANHAKSEFIANISHELRTPLNHVLGFAQILEDDASLTENQKDNLEFIIQSGNHLLLIINDLIELSTIESGKLMLNAASFPLPYFLNRLADMFQLRAIQQDIVFETDFDDTLPEFITGDEKRLRQILLNLLGNAMKFTKKGKVRFRVQRVDEFHERETHKLTTSQPHNLRFEVEDTGKGIPPEQLEDIFAAFHQIGNRLLAQTEGIGLGLTISQRLCRMMGSELQVHSAVDQGSCFWFDLDLLPGGNDSNVEELEELFLLPETAELQHLYNLTQMGDIFALRQRVRDIEEHDNQFMPFTVKIQEWADALNLPAIQRFLEQYIAT